MAINKFNLLRNFVSKLETANAGMEAMQSAILEAMEVLEDGEEAPSSDGNGE